MNVNTLVTAAQPTEAQVREVLHARACDQRYAELVKIPKWQLTDRHIASGGLLRRTEYLSWSREELAKAVLEDELLLALPPLVRQ
jgi:hypothetical protein